MYHKIEESDWEDAERHYDDDEEIGYWEESECDDWKGENTIMYENIDEIIDSLSPSELHYWRVLFRNFLARSTLNPEAYEVNDSILVMKLKGNSFIYINNQLLGLCVQAIVRKICDEYEQYFYLSYDYDYSMQKIEKLLRSGADIQSSKPFKLLCCELKQWVESGYRSELSNPKLGLTILNQLKGKTPFMAL